MGTPLVEAEQNSSIRVKDLSEVMMCGRCSQLTEQRLIPFETSRYIAYSNDGPYALHRVFSCETRHKEKAPNSNENGGRDYFGIN
jgi:hypothetical protein